MRNGHSWAPTKFVYRRGKLEGSRDPTVVSVASRLITHLVAGFYDTHLRQFARGRLIDLGCGSVPLYAAYRQYVNESICVDWGNSPHKTDHLDAECDLTQNLPFNDARFDTIVLSDVLEHIPEPMRLWKEMSRILAPGGSIIMSVPFYYGIHEAPHDYYRYTEFALRRFVESSGLRVVVLEPFGGAPEVLADLISKTLAMHLPVLGTLCAAVIQRMTLAIIRTSVGRRMSARTRGTFPFGYFLVAERAE